MRYLKDFQSMQRNEFIEPETLDLIEKLSHNTGESNHFREVDRLYSELSSLNQSELKSIEIVLKKMTRLSCIKQLYKMKVTMNVIKNQNGEDKYVQSRGAISIEKGKRVQIAHYADLKDYVGDDIIQDQLKKLIKDPAFRANEHISAIKKIEPELNSINGL